MPSEPLLGNLRCRVALVVTKKTRDGLSMHASALCHSKKERSEYIKTNV